MIAEIEAKFTFEFLKIVLIAVISIADKALGYLLNCEHWDRHGGGLSLEADCPAPHKITSRMPTPQWDCESTKQLVCSLQSPLLIDDEATNISAYITLGAISGQYYDEKASLTAAQQVDVSFPYQDSAFTIQYQAWWDQPTGENCSLGQQTQDKLIATRFSSNRAQDWIETCRSFAIPHTKGAFISFKDASVTTSDYFGKNYQALIEIKLNESKDEKCLLRSRKTIL
jgi:hypothetical protein